MEMSQTTVEVEALDGQKVSVIVDYSAYWDSAPDYPQGAIHFSELTVSEDNTPEVLLLLDNNLDVWQAALSSTESQIVEEMERVHAKH